MTNSLITFIIPTVGRPSLINAIYSIKNQSVNSWKAIIIFDGVKSTIDKASLDDRFTIIERDKIGLGNSAGLVRNTGIDKVDTEFIGFVDDDDVLCVDYIEKLQQELTITPDLQVCIFRMYQPMIPPNYICPPPDENDFRKCAVGISFAMRKSLYDEGFVFVPNYLEDYILLDKIRKAKKKIVISKYLTYLVKDNDSNKKITNTFNRVEIN